MGEGDIKPCMAHRPLLIALSPSIRVVLYGEPIDYSPSEAIDLRLLRFAGYWCPQPKDFELRSLAVVRVEEGQPTARTIATRIARRWRQRLLDDGLIGAIEQSAQESS